MLLRSLITACLTVTLGFALSSCMHSPERLRGYSFDYTLRDREETGLIQVFDDGKKTYLQFSDWTSLQVTIVDDSDSVIPFERSGPYAVLAGRHAHLIVKAQGAATSDVVSGGRLPTPDTAPAPAAVATSISALPADATFAAEAKAKEDEIASLREQIASLEAKLAETKEIIASYAERLVIHFANNSSRLTDESHIQATADAVRGSDAIVVAGYTDATYANPAGEDLARHRAENVQAALIERGIPPSHLTIAYHAAGSFVAENQSDEGKALNRRVEIVPNASLLQARR